jgi:tetratricopeptide (TPR) repeat protein
LAKDNSLNQRKALYQQMVKLVEEGKYQEAIPLAEKAVKIARRLRGPEHPDTATNLNNLAELYLAMGKLCQSRTAISGSAPDPTEGFKYRIFYAIFW